MPYQVTLEEDLSNIVLPDGLRHRGGDVVTLSNWEYGMLSATALDGFFSSVVDLNGIPLPSGSPADGDGAVVTQASPLQMGWQAPGGGGSGSALDLAVRSATANTAAADGDCLIECDASGGAFTVFLPTDGSLPTGTVIIVKKTDSSGNAVSFGPDTGVIDGYGSAAVPLPAQWDWAAVCWDGSVWTQVGGNVLVADGTVSGTMSVVGTMELTDGAVIKFGESLDTDLYRLGDNSLATDGEFTAYGAMSSGGYVQVSGAAHIYSGSGAPTLTGVMGDIYLRTGSGASDQRIYFCAGGASWTGIV